MPNCNSCIRNNVCGDCTGDLLVENGQCLSCQVDNCQTCSASNFCSQCQEGYSLIAGNTATSDQCLGCLDPCLTCDANGVCLTCIQPFNSLPVNGVCFLCNDPHCAVCTNSSSGTCSSCDVGYSSSNGVCQKECADFCVSCTSLTVCLQCQSNFYYLQNGACFKCPSAPACLTCNPTNPSICTSCS